MSAKGSSLLMFHGAISLAAVLAISFFNGEKVASIVHVDRQQIVNVVDVGVEHTAPLSLTIDVSHLKGSAIIEVTNAEGGETIFMSVPEHWERREVRNTTIAEVISEESSFGFMRWSLPSGGVISFRSATVPQSMVLHNPSEVPVKVTTNLVDLTDDSIEHDIILVQESSAVLW